MDSDSPKVATIHICWNDIAGKKGGNAASNIAVLQADRVFECDMNKQCIMIAIIYFNMNCCK
jgi:hypothetical protein